MKVEEERCVARLEVKRRAAQNGLAPARLFPLAPIARGK